MRYYDINVEGGPHYSSMAGDGTGTDPGALLVEMDIQVIAADTPASGSYVRIWGVGLDAIGQSRALFGKKITIKGGMAKGLPLANPAQQGVLAGGVIWQSFGNWIGLEQTLDLVMNPGGGDPPTVASPNPQRPNKNLVLNWKKGKKLEDALKQTLQTAFQGMQSTFDISDNLVAPQDQVGFFNNLEQLATYIRRKSQEIIGTNYPGVSILLHNNAFNVFDKPLQSGAGTIDFQDLIGQPTWIDPQTIQFKTVMRGDLKVGQSVTLPKTLVTQTQAGYSAQVNQSLAFQGTFNITGIRHVGNSRQSDAAAWVSIFDAVTNQDAAGA